VLRPAQPVRARLGEERGFTLIEVLVAMVCGLVVMGALFAILEVGLHQSSRLTDVSSATQSGRITLTRMVDELHSACISTKYVPVKAGSTESKLILVDGYSQAAELPPTSKQAATPAEGVRKDEITWTEEPAANANKEGSLTDKAFLATEGPNSEGEYIFSGKATPEPGVRIGERISRPKSGEELLPIFSYYAYAAEASSSTSSASSALSETPIKISGALTAEQAKTVAAVGIAFHSFPPDKVSTINKSIKETGSDLSTQTTLDFSAPNSESTLKAGPCE
jgi:prepilin-type N-terminal cleavage/methylation domain-containing protein